MSLWPRGRHAQPPPTEHERQHARLRTLDVAARVEAAAEQLDRAVARLEPTLQRMATEQEQTPERKGGR